jgi:hypothetical protein
MAKPEFGSLPAPAPASNSSARHPTPSPSRASNRVNRAPRSRPRRHPSPPAFLALLSAVSASPLAAHGYPLEPSETALPFLYPPFLYPTLTPPSLAKRAPDPSTSTAASSTTPTPPAPPSGCPQDEYRLPDKYAQGDDGRWHKTQWSLYGSIYCPVSLNYPSYVRTVTMRAQTSPRLFSLQGSCPPPSSVASPLQNDINDPSRPSPTGYPPPADDFDIASLPTGWSTVHTDNDFHGTAVIVALSVALAAMITILFSFIFWRRKRSRKRDPEKKGGTPPNIAEDDNSVREAKAAQKKWYKAANRWRGNLRFSARRRRTDRLLAQNASHVTLSPELEREIDVTDMGSSTYHSRASSPTPSVRTVTSAQSDVHASSSSSIRSSRSQRRTPQVLAFQAPPTDSPPLSPLSAQPPAYHPRASFSSSSLPHASELTYSDRNLSSKESLSLRPPPPMRGDDDSHLSSLSGHVATDDKAILSQRAALASAPLGTDSNFPQAASVPSMEEEDMFELPPGSRPTSPSGDAYGYEPRPPYSPPTSMLPPPPSKGKQKFDYSHDWDICADVDITLEPQLGPSAPPFEESEVEPSAPPFDLHMHVPSAPPMDTEDCPATTTIAAPEDADTVLTIPEHADPSGHHSGD